MGIRIIGTGMYVPERILTNADLEKMVDTSDEWITTRTGIKNRRIADAETTTSDLAFQAARNALLMADLPASSLDLIIVATVTPDKVFPSTACLLQTKLGAGPCLCFDLEAACSGLLYAIEVAHAMMAASPNYRRALVVGAEKLSAITDWTDRNTCVIFGDGAGAVILDKSDDYANDFYLAGKLCADGQYADILQLPAGGSALPASHTTVDERQHYVKMGGSKTFQMAISLMANTCAELLEQTGMSWNQVRWLIPHQANERILTAVGARLGIPERVYVNIRDYGNTSSASIGIALDELNRAGKIQPGDFIMLTAFGGGLTWGALLLRW
ncbi:MAG TPA: beta-ketoacyl-ACP synthase III [Lentisphaeria bacterium]|nr:ketoacyl-ACP synthase III [Lentisphaerota bacterium]OQC14654.1 MAG: 3-oxoacyl-(acyl-carrier-protein) synthase 3 [Lentisphaerae bacterium ADurb.Bin082]HPY90954.1 beta-ketoacyl-ACP synthase III [Lentisphaeria bacterium]HQL88794.1 beta-ketoacyl-ACP synthase III [Lentisphaeria bacterium]